VLGSLLPGLLLLPLTGCRLLGRCLLLSTLSCVLGSSCWLSQAAVTGAAAAVGASYTHHEECIVASRSRGRCPTWDECSKCIAHPGVPPAGNGHLACSQALLLLLLLPLLELALLLLLLLLLLGRVRVPEPLTRHCFRCHHWQVSDDLVCSHCVFCVPEWLLLWLL
jgi:hypothetical protein